MENQSEYYIWSQILIIHFLMVLFRKQKITIIMKNIIILIAVLVSFNSQAQKVNWVPSTESDGGCSMVTDCATNTLCYSLEYTPESTGILTSYTTGFFTSCIDGAANLLHNQSCVINDKSSMISACEEFGKTLLNCSGNTGQIMITKDEPIILHQVCFDIDVKEEVELLVDPVMGITVSIDLLTNGFTTSKPKYEDYTASTRDVETPCDLKNDIEIDAFDASLALQVFPNPTSGSINVFFNDGGLTADMSIITSDNKRMMTQTIDCNKKHSFNLNDYHGGTYIVRIKGENKSESKKFIIIK